MNKYSYNNLTIEIFNDSTFSINSNDNLEVYENISNLLYKYSPNVC